MPLKPTTKAALKASKSKVTSPKAKRANTTPKKQPSKSKSPPRPQLYHLNQRETVLPLPNLHLCTLLQTPKRSCSTSIATLILPQRLKRSVRDPTCGGFLRTLWRTARRPSRESPPQDWG
ncbi:hypothetical protein DSO57_1008140 [Entomophthora muscae]|uniref:Uncharacterized protein n=1 Tax=Entomophthora muscae TaxID=34485 RepID=A0ACC2SJW9_9FUNG|nr:hypothetical protein DSO57_1008140 [Entomophthora muscae]